MAKQSDIIEGAKFKVNNRIGTAYAVTDKKIENYIIDLIFDDGGCIVEGKEYAPPSGRFRIEKLKLVK
jgi:hypothetical protein